MRKVSRDNGKLYIIRFDNTPGTRGGPGGRDQTLAVKGTKNTYDFIIFY